VQWKKGDLARLPLRDGSVDVTLLSQSLHHAAAPDEALTEAVRILRPGGRLLVLDLRKHDQKWVTTKFGDRWLGFTEAELDRLLREAGLRDVRAQVGARQSGDPFVVLIASGAKPIQPVPKPDASTTQHPSQARKPLAMKRARRSQPKSEGR
jgi:SAM-dependent methyltransferase